MCVCVYVLCFSAHGQHEHNSRTHMCVLVTLFPNPPLHFFNCTYATCLAKHIHPPPTSHTWPLFTFSLLAHCRCKMHLTRFHCTRRSFGRAIWKAFDGFSLLICNSTLLTVFVVPLHHTIIRFSLYLSFAYFLALSFSSTYLYRRGLVDLAPCTIP